MPFIWDFLTLKMKALCFFNTSGTTHSTVWHPIPEDLNHCNGIVTKYVGHIAIAKFHLFMSISTVSVELLSHCHMVIA
jgi:hypothetical protein